MNHLKWLAPALATCLLVACGGGSDTTDTSAPASVAQLQMPAKEQTTEKAQQLSTLGSIELFDWAQIKYPSLLAGSFTDFPLEYQGISFSVRSIPSKNAYLGLSANGEVFALAPFTNNALQSFGPLSGFRAQIEADLCAAAHPSCATSSPAPLASSNFSSVATQTAAALRVSSSIGRTFSNLLRDENFATASTSNPNVDNSFQLAQIARQQDNTSEKTKEVKTINEQCAGGGSVTATFNDADNNKIMTAGDIVSVSAQACIERLGDPALNGTGQFALNSVERTAGKLGTVSSTLSYDNFSDGDGNSFSGTIDITGRPGQVIRIEYKNFKVVNPSSTNIYNLVANVANGNSNSSIRLQGSITVNNNTYTVSTPTNITYSSRGPSAGKLTITDTSNNRVEVVGKPIPIPAGSFDIVPKTSLDISLFNGASSVPAASAQIPWSSI